MEIAASFAPPLRLAVVDDENLIRDGLVCLFRKAPGLEIVVQAGTSAEAVAALEGRFVDVALVDVCVGPSDSWGGVGAWQQASPGVRIVVLDDLVRDVHLRRVLRLGMHGYAAKRDSFAELLEIVRAAGRGEQQFSRSANGSSLRPWAGNYAPHPTFPACTCSRFAKRKCSPAWLKVARRGLVPSC